MGYRKAAGRVGPPGEARDTDDRPPAASFHLLMLYWLETGVIAFWTIVRIATIPPAAPDDPRFGSGKRTVLPPAMAAFFAVHAGIFMGAHFILLWAFFSADWAPRFHGPRDFIEIGRASCRE